MTFTTAIHIGIGLDVGASNLFRNETGPDGLLRQLDAAADLIILEDRFARPDGDGLDAVLFANWLGARTRNAGIVAGAPINALEPFHLSTAIATLDYVTEGRAGLLAQSLKGEHATATRRATGPLNGYPADHRQALELDFDEAIDVIRQLWDSWEDDAVIRDLESQRFVDGAKLRYVDFKGANFSVLGPSITPRPPQGQPIIATTLRAEDDATGKANIDLVFLDAGSDDLASLWEASRSTHPNRRYFADIKIGPATEVKGISQHWQDASEALVTKIHEWAAVGLSGIRLLPDQSPRDLHSLVDHLLPALRAAGIGQTRQATTLRERLALPAATNRYVQAA